MTLQDKLNRFVKASAILRQAADLLGQVAQDKGGAGLYAPDAQRHHFEIMEIAAPKGGGGIDTLIKMLEREAKR